jgi:uncharacterized OsmC-like protein
VNGGELLLAALATCACNDLFREAAKRGIELGDVEIAVQADFPAEGSPAQDVVYHVTLSGMAEEDVLRELVRSTDMVTEIQNTVRSPVPVRLGEINVVPGH